MLRSSAARPVRAFAFVAFILGVTRLVLAASAPADQASAAGNPIGPSCAAMQATIDKLKSGLPLQNEWIKRSEDQLRAAEDGVRGSQDELKNMAVNAAFNLVKHQLQLISDMKTMARAAKSAEARNRLLDRIKLIENATEKIEAAEKLGKAGVEGNQLGTAIAQNRAQLVDFIKFVNESGISDELGIKAAEFAGPVGVAVVETFTVARDVVYASFQGKMSADEAAVHRQNLQGMKSAKADVETRIYELSTELAQPGCTPTPRPQDRISVINPDPDPAPRTPVPAQTKPPKKGPGVGTALVVVGAGALGGVYLYDKYGNIAGGQCKSPTTNVLTQCSTYGGASSQCSSSIAEANTYCKCEGYAKFDTIAGGCR